MNSGVSVRVFLPLSTSPGCQPRQVIPHQVWDGTCKPETQADPPAGTEVTAKEDKSGQDGVERLRADAACPQQLHLGQCHMHLPGDKQWAAPAHKPQLQMDIPGIPIVSPSLTSSLLAWLLFLFPGLMEISEKPSPPFAPGAGAKIHLFVNEISLKSSPNSMKSSKVGSSRSTFIK